MLSEGQVLVKDNTEVLGSLFPRDRLTVHGDRRGGRDGLPWSRVEHGLTFVRVNLDSPFPEPLAQSVCGRLESSSDSPGVTTGVVNSRVVSEKRQLGLFTLWDITGEKREG